MFKAVAYAEISRGEVKSVFRDPKLLRGGQLAFFLIFFIYFNSYFKELLLLSRGHNTVGLPPGTQGY